MLRLITVLIWFSVLCLATEYIIQYFTNTFTMARAMDNITPDALRVNKLGRAQLPYETFQPKPAGKKEHYTFSASPFVDGLAKQYHSLYFIVRVSRLYFLLLKRNEECGN